MRNAGQQLRRRSASLALLASICGLTFLMSCKTASQAAASAQQLNTVATQLAAYYDDLAAQLDDTVMLNQVQSAFYGIPFSQQDREQIVAVKGEIARRTAMAHSLADLATAYGNLAGSKAGSDVSTSASGLADALSGIKPLPQCPPISDAAGGAAQLLTQFVQTHDLKKGATAVSKAAVAVSEIFDKEKQAITNKLLKDGKIDVDFAALVAPATKPFALTPKGEDVSADPAYAQLLKSDIEYQVLTQQREFGDSTDRLATALRDARNTVDRVVNVK